MGEKPRKGEGIEEKWRDGMYVCGGEHQEETVRSQRNKKPIGRKVTEGRK